jgi:hypothetical protein
MGGMRKVKRGEWIGGRRKGKGGGVDWDERKCQYVGGMDFWKEEEKGAVKRGKRQGEG